MKVQAVDVQERSGLRGVVAVLIVVAPSMVNSYESAIPDGVVILFQVTVMSPVGLLIQATDGDVTVKEGWGGFDPITTKFVHGLGRLPAVAGQLMV